MESNYDQLIERGTKDIHILVLGDIMLDRYYFGKVNRISPEAPVLILEWEKEEIRLGGASNVMQNLLAMGCTASLISIAGKDDEAEILKTMLEAENPNRNFIFQEELRATTVKNRYMAQDRQIMRMDKESLHKLDLKIERMIIDKFNTLLKDEKIDAVIFEDYNKGFFSSALIKEIIQICKLKKIITCVDPKKEHFYDFQGVSLFKPNLKEAKEALIGLDAEKISSFQQIAEELHARLESEIILLTLAESGLFIKTKNKYELYSTRPVQVKDVSGAGDTVISLATIGLVLGLPLGIIATLCNLGAAQVCEQPGVESVKIDKLLAEFRATFL